MYTYISIFIIFESLLKIAGKHAFCIKILVRTNHEKPDSSIPDNPKGSAVDLSIGTNERARMYMRPVHDGQDTSRIFYPGSFSSLIDSIGEKHGETGFNPLGGFASSSPPHHPRFRQPTAVTRRQNQPPSE